MRTGIEGKVAPAYVELAAASLLWSTGGFLIRWVQWNPLAIAGMRSAIASAVILAYVRKPRFTWSASQIGAALCYSLTVFLFVSAVKLAGAANAIMLQYTAPVYTALFGGLYLGERPRWSDWLFIAAALGGVFLFFSGGLDATQYLGNSLALATGLTLAWMGMFMRKQKEGSPIESVLLGNIVTAAAGFPFTLRTRPDPSGWVGLSLLGVFQLGVSYILFSDAVKKVRALDAILVCTLEPVLNPLWVFILMGERPGPRVVAGGCVIVLSITLRAAVNSVLAGRRKPERGAGPA